MRQIQRWIARYNNPNFENRPLQSLPRPGRSPFFNQANIDRINDYTTEHPFTSARQITEELHLQCSPQTVRNVLHKSGIHCRRLARKVYLSAEHAVARLQFAEQHLNRDQGQTIFSDEKVFSTSDDIMPVLWRPNNTRYNPQNVQPERRSGRISCGFWGQICASGPGEIVQITGRLTGEDYKDILEDVFLPSARVFFPEGQITLVQDNSPIHTSRTVRQWFDQNPEIVCIPWPSKSPDLNPIENLWGLMVRNFNDRHNVRNRNELERNVKDVWENMRGSNYCEQLVNSMGKRLSDCIENRGYYTKY